MHKVPTKPTHPAPITNEPITKKIQYNDRFITAQLTEMLQELIEDETIKSKAQLFKNRPYSRYKFSEWNRKYQTNKSIQNKLKKIEDIIEARLVKQGLEGKSIPMTIFLLKNYYNYTDQYQHKVDETVTFKVTRGRAPIEAEIVTQHNTVPKQIKPSH